jgi:hypothetical protein
MNKVNEIALMALIALLPLLLQAEMRLDKRATHRVDYIYEYNDYFYYTRYVDEEASYLPGEPEVLETLIRKDRLIDWDGSDSGWVTLDPYQYNPQVSYNQTGRQVHYHLMPQNRHRVEQYDQQGRLLSLCKYFYQDDNTVYSISRNYFSGDSTDPDSVVTANYTLWPPEHRFQRIINSYDANGIKLSSTTFVSADSTQWNPYRRSIYYTSPQSLPQGFKYRLEHPIFDLTSAGMHSSSFLVNISGLYGRAMVDSIRVEYFENGEWSLEELHLYQYLHNDAIWGINVTMYDLDYMEIPDYYPRAYNLSFSPEGYFTGHYWSVDDGFGPPTYGEISYSWEAPVSTADPHNSAPIVANLLAFPNPFNPTTHLQLSLLQSSRVKLAIYNLRGQLICILRDGRMDAGEHLIPWDAAGLASGIYFAIAETEYGKIRQRIVLAK